MIYTKCNNRESIQGEKKKTECEIEQFAAGACNDRGSICFKRGKAKKKKRLDAKRLLLEGLQVSARTIKLYRRLLYLRTHVSAIRSEHPEKRFLTCTREKGSK